MQLDYNMKEKWSENMGFVAPTPQLRGKGGGLIMSVLVFLL